MSTSSRQKTANHLSEARPPAAEPPGEGRYHHGNLRETLVEAGLTLLESQQSAEFSLRELARQLGVSPNATYRHFANKDALMAGMAAEGFRRLAAVQLQVAASQADARQSFLAVGAAYVSFARQNPALFRLMFGRYASAHRSPEMIEAGQLAYEGLRHGLAAIMGVEVEAPQVAVAAVHAWSLVHGLSHLILDGQLDEFGDDLDALIGSVLQWASHRDPAATPAKPQY